MESLQDKVILITGGGQGLGEQITRVLAEAGAVVLPADIKADNVEKVAADLISNGKKAKAYMLDVGDEQSVQETIDQIVKKYKRIDAVINNAGIDVTKSIEELSITEWDRVIRVNLRGPFLLSKTVFPIMDKQGGGSIVNITSTAAKRTWANASAYHASKWGLLGFSHGMHVEGREKNIKVTAVVSGGMRTPFIMERFPDTDPNVLQDPKNVANVVKFVLTQPAESVIPEVMILPMKETSWP
jgi:NADP-dependent 3-hydroxy acid dehydrogenase YdfG